MSEESTVSLFKNVYGCLLSISILLGAGSAVQGAEKTPSRPPNFLLLISDDQRPDTIAALGNRVIATPHLDSLVRSGTTFNRAITAHPLCLPSRAEILTGCTSFRTGVPYPAANITPELSLWPQTMQAAGYHTWYVGKWHTSGRPSTRGYLDTLGLYSGGGAPWAKETTDWRGRPITGYRGWIFQSNDGKEKFPEKGVGLTPNISSLFADAAIEFINRRPEKPFFLHVNFTAPHDPLLLPPGYESKYDPADMPLPANFKPEHPFDHGNFNGRDEVLFDWPRTPEAMRDALAVYYAVISHLDQQIGRILAALKETGQADNTIVIFTSDHGLALGSHGLTGKQNMYQHTIGVPLIFSGPGIPAGAQRNAQCYLRDLYPTVCRLASIPIPDTVQGRSLVPVIEGKADKVHDYAIAYFMNTQRMIRTDRYKLIYYPAIDRTQLFDLVEDPDELHDLSAKDAHAATVTRLRKELDRWRKENDDPLLR